MPKWLIPTVVAAVLWLGIGLVIIFLAWYCNDRGPANTALGRYERQQKRQLEKLMYDLISLWVLPIAIPILIGILALVSWTTSILLN